jgi:hypothetical protein
MVQYPEIATKEFLSAAESITPGVCLLHSHK